MGRGRKQLHLRRTGTRGNQRVARPSFGAALKDASRRAHQRANHRTWKRSGLTSIEAAIAGTGYAPPETVSGANRIMRVLWGCLLLPFCFITTITLFQRVIDPHFANNFWKTDVFIYFTVGFVLHAGWFLTRLFQNLFLYLYVLGHELTHAIFVYVCLGNVSGFRVGLDGGHIVTNKSNLLIALSPYFVPFWSVIVLAIASLIALFAKFQGQDQALFALMGATWSFHLFWTIWIIPRDQPDLKENGTFLSLTIIFLANIVILSGLLCIASHEVTWRDFVYNWANNGVDLVSTAYEMLASFLQRT